MNNTRLITPFEELTHKERAISTLIIVGIITVMWSTSTKNYIPPPMEILQAFPKLFSTNDIVGNFIHSLTFCLVTMSYSIVISLFFAYLSVIPIFETLCGFLRKFRFLPSAGLSFLFMKITQDIQGQMKWMMIWGITTWMLDSMIGVALSISADEKLYARSLRLNGWQRLREVLIKGRSAEMFKVVISIFAMAWMLLACIENIAKASGGIGVTLADSAKYFKYDQVYALQLLILITGITIDYLLNQLRKLIFPYDG